MSSGHVSGAPFNFPLLRNQLGYGVRQSPLSLPSYCNSGTSKLRFHLLNSFPFVHLLLPAIPASASPFTHYLPFRIASCPYPACVLVASIAHRGRVSVETGACGCCGFINSSHELGQSNLCAAAFVWTRVEHCFSFNEVAFIFLTGTVFPENKEPAPPRLSAYGCLMRRNVGRMSATGNDKLPRYNLLHERR